MLFGAGTSPGELRGRFERFGSSTREGLLRKYPQLSFSDHEIGRLHVEAVRSETAPRRVVIHLHGGAFLFGSANSYRNRAMRFSYRLGAEVFVPEYRLAPEHPFPAALEDALVSYQYVRALRPHSPVLITGDSAGGGLAASLLVRLRELGEPQPEGAILLSPWTDLSSSGPSVDENQGKDRWFSRAHLERWASYYVGKADPRSPLLSPVFADLSGLPPMLVLVGEDELLRDDAIRLVVSAQHSGTDARLLVGAGMQHDWPLTLPRLAESRSAWKAMTEFADECCVSSRASFGSGRASGSAVTTGGVGNLCP
jgi:acetyl esterase/lipase